MSKKKWIQTAIFILIPVLAVWIYVQYFQSRYLFHEAQTLEVEVRGPREVVLTSEDKNLDVASLELEFSGKLDGIMDIAIEGKAGIVQVISLKGPAVDRSFLLPWDGHSCTLRFAGRENARAQFRIDYRFMESD